MSGTRDFTDMSAEARSLLKTAEAERGLEYLEGLSMDYGLLDLDVEGRRYRVRHLVVRQYVSEKRRACAARRHWTILWIGVVSAAAALVAAGLSGWSMFGPAQ